MQIAENKFSLTSHGLANIYKYEFEKDFLFKVGGHEYQVPRVLAYFISPKIAKAAIADPFLKEFEINVDDNFFQFNLIIRLMKGENVNVSFFNAHYLLEVAHELQNQEIIDLILSFLATPFKPETIVLRLQQKASFHGDIHSEIEYIAENFTKINTDLIKELDNDTLYSIFLCEKLTIKSESSLFEFITKLIDERGSSAKFLLECVYYENITDADMNLLWNYIPPENLHGPILESIKRRSIHQPLPKSLIEKRYLQKSVELFYQSNAFSGIFNYLTKKCGGNPHEMNIIEIIPSSSSGGSSNSHTRVIDFSWSNYWASNNSPNSYIRFDFKTYRVQINAYSLKSRSESPGGGHPKSWVIEGSNDGTKWDIIDYQHNSNDINGSRLVHTFQLSEMSQSFKYLQMKLTSENHRGDNFFNLTNIEFFGKLIEPIKLDSETDSK